MTTTGFRHLQVEPIGKVCVAKLLSESLSSPSIINLLTSEWNRIAERDVLLDFSGVTIIASMMLGRLIELQERLTANEGKLVICGLQPKVLHVFALTRLTGTFNIAADRTEGLAAF
jgi:anti-anti-sigma factor